MPHPFKFTIKNNKTEELETLKGQFTDAEWARLGEFLESAYRLASSRIAQTSSQLSFGFSWRKGTGLTYRATLPPEADTAAFLHWMRPFVLKREPAYFYAACNILSRRLALASARRCIQALRDRYAGKAIPFTMSIGPLVLTAEDALDQWLNAFEYHHDPDKRSELRAMYEVFPEASARAVFIYSMLERASAVGKLAAIINSLVKQDGSEVRLRL